MNETDRLAEEGVAVWRAARQEWPRPEHPAPEIPLTRVPRTDERVPKPSKAVWSLAERCGWRVVGTYCRGTTLMLRGEGRVVDSFALRCRRGSDRVVLIWHDGRTVGGFVKTLAGTRKVDLTHGKGVLASRQTEGQTN